ncbi:hypothetical protein PCANC_20689 [Puccinia coronata f. sp. avenae]|uniref:Uncharacterized protein n=1 Tax=Puccinia coronata f. sp. avenae TaxID=200324 RepID=A0A2N5TZS1_9BASI|nr:hypothetical protein PCANC_20689 [Puccinia coronata f. sp. avenae]PLW47654.1 hypothetical protein PCASD_04128 [Puccinia coronata f. sp. avenae]
MRFFRFDPSVLISSLKAWNILQGVQPMEFKKGLSRSHSTTHLNLYPSDQVDSNYMKDQLKGWLTRKQSSEAMTSESSYASPVTAACQKLDKASLPKKNKITHEVEAMRFYIKSLNNLHDWASELLQSRLTIEEKSSVKKKLEIVKQQIH